MRKLLILLVAFFALGTVLFAQQESQDVPEAPRAELFAGFAYMHTNLQNYDPLNTENLTGETLQATVYLRQRIGITADVTRATGSNLSQSGVNATRYLYLFGPTYALQTSSSVTPFAHLLFGEDHERFSVSNLGDTISTSFAEDAGAGFDVQMTDHWSIRPAQIDFIHTNHSGGESHFRYTAGLVCRF
jgi:hypothetical protein